MKFFFSRGMLIYLAGILLFLTMAWLIMIHVSTQWLGHRETQMVRVIRATLPSVVNISSHLERSASDLSGNIVQSGKVEDFKLGTGIVIDPNGLILTNEHVVTRNNPIFITLSSGSIFRARLIASDQHNDIALLRLIDPPRDLKRIKLARINDVMLGEDVIAIGNPFGLDSSVTRGVISAVNRRIVKNEQVVFSDILQTDAAIFPGNSGGPLINMDGEMVGMNVLTLKEHSGIGFAIPLERLENTVAKWLIPENFLGLSLGLVAQTRTTLQGKPELYVEQVFPNSPAERAGVIPGNVIQSLDGETDLSLPDFSYRMIRLKLGDVLNFHFLGRREPIGIVVQDLPSKNGLILAHDKLEIDFQVLTPELARLLSYGSTQKGLVVQDILIPKVPGKIQRGDVLVSLDGKPVTNSNELYYAVFGKKQGDVVIAEFLRSFPEKKDENTPVRKTSVELKIQ